MKIHELNSQRLLEVSQELENLNFRLLHEVPDSFYLKNDHKSWMEEEKSLEIINNKNTIEKVDGKENSSNGENTQFKSFQRAMKILIGIGLVMGLYPVRGILGEDVLKMRFTVFSWLFLYTVLRAIVQTIATCISLYAVYISPGIYTSSLGQASFCISTWCSTFIFLRIASKWDRLAKEIYNCKLDRYIDPNLSLKCSVTCIIFLFLAAVEYTFSSLRAVAEVLDCASGSNSLYERFLTTPFLLSMNTDTSYFIPLGFILQVNHMIMAVIWTYSDIFIICVSIYLTSILEQINKRIIWAADKTYLLPSIWGTLRQEYSRATHLVRQFDDVFNGLILASFAMNLFFICLKFFNVLENGVEQKIVGSRACPNYPSGHLHGYEYPTDQIYCLVFLIVRFLTVSLVASNVNVASLLPASSLYKVPSCSYSVEVQRFLDQVHDDVVALSGMEYFYITKGLVLSVVGTIFTYELVLLQFNGEELNTD